MTQPGWFDDPYSPVTLRWWDGLQWTPYTVPRPAPVMQHLPPDLDATTQWGRRASITVVLAAAVFIVESIYSPFILHRLLHDTIDQIRDYSHQLDEDPTAQLHLHLPSLLWVNLGTVVSLAAQVVFIVWFAKAATNAERLALPHARSPIWAILGFFVPIVNFWFPYQVARDLIPPGDPRRRIAAWWWGCYLGQVTVSIVCAVISFWDVPMAVLVAVFGCALPILTALKARELITAVSDSHSGLVRP